MLTNTFMRRGGSGEKLSFNRRSLSKASIFEFSILGIMMFCSAALQ